MYNKITSFLLVVNLNLGIILYPVFVYLDLTMFMSKQASASHKPVTNQGDIPPLGHGIEDLFKIIKILKKMLRFILR